VTPSNTSGGPDAVIRARPATRNRIIRVAPPEPLETSSEQAAAPPMPSDGFCTFSADQVLALAETILAIGFTDHDGRATRSRRRISLRMLLHWLETFPGESWQQRWDASGVEDDSEWMTTITDAFNAANGSRYQSGYGALGAVWMIAMDVIRPSYGWMHRQHGSLRTLYTVLFFVRDPSGQEAIVAAVDSNTESEVLRTRYRVHALYQLARILGHTGKRTLAEITVEDLRLARESARGNRDKMPSGAAYNAMSWAGLLPTDAPETFLDTLRTGQQTVEELVTRTGIRSEKVRDLFIDYFRARSVGLDYTSLTGLVGTLVLNFWVEIEHLSPGIETLNLPPDLVDQWKNRVRIIRNGTKAGSPRKDHGSLLIAVRAFYYDINDWAQSDPERYGQFAGPNPIGRDDTIAFAKQQRRRRSASHQRTRERQPLLSTLMNWVSDNLQWHRQALDLARKAGVGQVFAVSGVECEVVGSVAGLRFGTTTHGRKRIGGLMVRRLDTGETFDVVHRETVLFWRWASFTVLKETGARIEEMEELTHTSITQYRLPSTGELLPLLQIAPSKTDQERVLLVSPDLADALAAIISRVRGGSSEGRIPLIRRWDYHEKVLSEPMPFLFQRSIDGQNRAINRAWVLKNLRLTVEEAGLVGEDGEPIYFQNHDLRRIFATEALLAGLPIHILAKILGHETLDTTQQYAAIYPEEVFRTHRSFIERRRSLRPSAEYRQPTEAEFDEFLGHFERRQLELGICGRAYGTPCIHEHACVRCSMLQLDPKQEGRLRMIADNLESRIQEAVAHGWLGEVEGLQVSLAGARQKLASVARPSTTGPVVLGFPTVRALNDP
jgi:hypothetical protein